LTDFLVAEQSVEMLPERSASPGTGRAPSFREVFETELDFVWNCLRRLGIPERDLEDEALEVFLRVQGAFADYDATRSIRPWIAGFAYRVACEYRRRPRHRFERMGTEIDAPETSASPEQSAAEGEERAMVTAALDRVETDRRAVLVLHDVYGYTMPEIAVNCDIPLNTAYSRLRLARAEFAQAIRRLGWRNEP
jgi:RNA polymerase sigma-70 factor (ECF subfamily)